MLRPSDNSAFNALDILHFLYRWKKPLIIVGITSILGSIIFSMPFFIKPRYKATTIFFSASTNTVGKILLSGTARDILEFGDEQNSEQLMQILHSRELREKIFKKYNLMEHYEIDADEKYPRTALEKEFNENVSIERTEFISVKLTVTDTDPQLAADIANDMVAYMDTFVTDMQRKRALEGLKIVEKAYNDKLLSINKLIDSTTRIRRKGVYDYIAQSKLLNKALLRNKGTNRELIQSQLNTLAEYGGSFLNLNELLYHQRKDLIDLKAQYDKALVDANTFLPHKFVVSYARKAEKKSSPIRWLIVLLTFGSAMLLSILTIIGIENFQALKTLNKEAEPR
jgi:capsular polysaccharide biosynthesis protein